MLSLAVPEFLAEPRLPDQALEWSGGLLAQWTLERKDLWSDKGRGREELDQGGLTPGKSPIGALGSAESGPAGVSWSGAGRLLNVLDP